MPNSNVIDAGVAFPELLGLADVALDVGLVPEGDDVEDMEACIEGTNSFHEEEG